MRLVLFYVWIGWLSMGYCQGQGKVVALSPSSPHVLLSLAQMQWYEDPTHHLSFADVVQLSQMKQFSAPPKNNLGVSTSTHWLRLDFEHHLPAQAVILQLACRMDEFTVYYQQGGKWTSQALGIQQTSFDDRPIRYHYFALPIPALAQNTQTVFVRLKSHEAIKLLFSLHSLQSFQHASTNNHLTYGWFYGAICIIILYHAFLLFALKDINYLWHIVFSSLNLLVVALRDGYYLYVLPNAGFWFNHSNQVVVLLILMGLVFSSAFLSTHVASSRVHRWFMRMFGLGVLYLLASFVLPIHWVAEFTGYYTFVVIIVLFASSTYLFAKGQKSARYFVLAWFFYMIGGILEALGTIAGVSSSNLFIQNAFYIGTILEVLFFSFALADKFNIYRKEKDLAQQFALEKTQENEQLVKEQNRMLEHKVAERTQELQHANEELKGLNEEITVQHQQLTHTHWMLSQSVKAAQHIQQATLPFDDHIQSILPHYFILFRPRHVVSGDFYWIEEVQGHKFVIAVDCTGHGIPGAFMSMVANTLLTNIIKVDKVFEPALILEALHQKVVLSLQQDKSNDKSGMDVALLTLKYNPNNTAQVKFAGAKRPLYYIKNHTLQRIKGTRKAIGSYGASACYKPFVSHELTLPKGALLYLGSDGLVDQNNPQQKKFGMERLEVFLASHAALPMALQKRELAQALDEHMQDIEQRDDILWMGVRL
jgi:serine phosphatase RsbU (regulator of sigma subunit)